MDKSWMTEGILSIFLYISYLPLCSYAPAVLEAAIHFINKNSRPEKALAASLKFAGPDNFCPVLVGSFIGAILGRDGVRNVAEHELTTTSRAMLMRLSAAAQLLSSTWSDSA